MAETFLADGQPAISVDTKKKELVGEFANGGREWHPKGEPTEVNVHDFVDKQLGRAVPYGIYDLANDEGWASVGDSAGTAEFAVNSVRTWWANMGGTRYPTATPPAHHGGRRRFQRLPPTGLESTTGQAGDRAGLGGDGVPLPAGDFQVEPDRAPDVQFHHHELARPAARFLPGHSRANFRHRDKKPETTGRP